MLLEAAIIQGKKKTIIKDSIHLSMCVYRSLTIFSLLKKKRFPRANLGDVSHQWQEGPQLLHSCESARICWHHPISLVWWQSNQHLLQHACQGSHLQWAPQPCIGRIMFMTIRRLQLNRSLCSCLPSLFCALLDTGVIVPDFIGSSLCKWQNL